MSTQQCDECRVEKPLSEYHKCRNRKSGVKGKCKPCTSKYMRERQKRLPPVPYGRGRDKHLRQRYGISHAEYDVLLQAQGGGCAICGSTEPGKGFKHFHVDHDHATGQVRGLLCAPCNQALGLFREDSSVLQQAVAYLSRYGGGD